MSENAVEDLDMVTFENDPRTWILKEKVHEGRSQDSQSDFELSNVSSKVWEVYVCENYANPSEEAVIKIYKQIPYAGSEFNRPQIRRKQALGVDGAAEIELGALKLFTEKGCTSTPKLLAFEEETQSSHDSVPGGYILYLLMEKLPGSRIDKDAFWHLDESERAKIREKFKDAWINCHNAGLVPSLGFGETFLWDSTSERLYFTGFKDSYPSDDWPEGWSEDEWDVRGLLKPPYPIQNPLPHPPLSLRPSVPAHIIAMCKEPEPPSSP